MSDLASALMVAIRVHADQRDKQGEPYLLHVLRVVEAVGADEDSKTVAALHDVAEDVGWGEIPGTLPLIDLHALKLLTRPAGMSYADYIERIAASGNHIAREVKLADLRDNLGRIPAGPYNERGGRADGGGEASMEAYEPDWRSLKARYEKAISVLEEDGMSDLPIARPPSPSL